MGHRAALRRALAAVVLAASGCVPRLPELRRYVAESPLRAVAVAPFAPAGDMPDSGRLAAEWMSRELASLGFEVVAATPTPPGASIEETLSAARRAGARALLAGELLQFSERAVDHPEEYEDRVRKYLDAAGKEQLMVDRILLRPGWLEYVSVFRASARLLDVDTGAVLWEGSTWSERRASGEAAASNGLETLARSLARALYRTRPRRPD